MSQILLQLRIYNVYGNIPNVNNIPVSTANISVSSTNASRSILSSSSIHNPRFNIVNTRGTYVQNFITNDSNLGINALESSGTSVQFINLLGQVIPMFQTLILVLSF